MANIKEIKIALAQINPTVGDITANAQKIRDYRAVAAGKGADLVIFTEFSIGGYPPEDLVKKPAFCEAAMNAIKALGDETKDQGPAIIVGGPRMVGGKLFNSLFICDDGKVIAYRDKYHLPNYGVFDEKRVFDQGEIGEPYDFHGLKLGLMICEDMWLSDVASILKNKGADILFAPQGSPFEGDKLDQRLTVTSQRVQETGLPLVLLNQVGGQDELVFDGSSLVMDANNNLVASMKSFEEDMIIINCSNVDGGWNIAEASFAPAMDEVEALYSALVLGLRDYVNKNGFPGVLIGMSGGVDSALTATIAVDALGADKVCTVMMPSRYTSEESVSDAKACSTALGASYESIDIEPIVASFGETLAPIFEGLATDTTEENIQARIRGVLLMALSNKFGHMVVATGNKSEMSVGYSTLYGDLCGGYALLKDVYKTACFELCRWRNENTSTIGLGPSGLVIPENIITKAPTAELRDNQKDEDSLPPYDQLDQILTALVEGELAIDDVVEMGFKKHTVARIEHMLYIAEYKRRQAPPGVKVTRKHFGRERRYPITNRFRDGA
jgi:NAD+ synthase